MTEFYTLTLARWGHWEIASAMVTANKVYTGILITRTTHALINFCKGKKRSQINTHEKCIFLNTHTVSERLKGYLMNMSWTSCAAWFMGTPIQNYVISDAARRIRPSDHCFAIALLGNFSYWINNIFASK